MLCYYTNCTDSKYCGMVPSVMTKIERKLSVCITKKPFAIKNQKVEKNRSDFRCCILFTCDFDFRCYEGGLNTTIAKTFVLLNTFSLFWVKQTNNWDV